MTYRNGLTDYRSWPACKTSLKSTHPLVLGSLLATGARVGDLVKFVQSGRKLATYACRAPRHGKPTRHELDKRDPSLPPTLSL